MNLSLRLLICSTCLASFTLGAEPSPPVRVRQRLDRDWRFALGHASDPTRDFAFATGYFSYLAKDGYGDGPAASSFDDRSWRQIDLPHDWAVEAPFDPRGTASHGFKAVGREFPDRSIGWYRKTFSIPASDLGRRIGIEFDGVFRDASVFVNGFFLGRHASGYTGFAFDLTDYLNYGGDNVIAVRVDATMEEGWFYEGAGIYRHVWLTKTAPLHVAHWGTGVATAVIAGSAQVSVRTTVVNNGGARARFVLRQAVVDDAGRTVATASSGDCSLSAGGSGEFATVAKVSDPRLWAPESPVLYRLVTTVQQDGVAVDRTETTFGIRSIAFDANRGFVLNGRRVELKGVNLHQDHAGVGVAVPDALWEYRLKQLKPFGVNAVRCAHNPPAPEFLDACDRLGILVLDENRGFGASPEQLGQLESMILRDRNHPSVILWSIGNEEWAVESNSKGARIASTMQGFAQRLDPTRRVTYANSGGWGGISTVIDVVGYNYISQSDPDRQHANYPRQPGVGTEETTTQGTRGVYFDDREHVHLAPMQRGDSGGNSEVGWKFYAARPFLAGLFYWTGFDYRGEPTPFGWPAVNSQMGLLDTCGFPKDSAYYLEAWWTDKPVLHLYPHWNWPGLEGKPITVRCYSNDEAVELYLNGAPIGRQSVPHNGHVEWQVPYAPGVLEARGLRGGRVVQTTRVETTGTPAQLVLAANRGTIRADGADVAVLTVSARDAQGRQVPTASNYVHLEITGGRIIGVGNGDPGCHEPDRFTPDSTLVTITDWRGRIAPAGTNSPGPAAALAPMTELGRWRASLPQRGELYDLAAAFELPAIPVDAEVELFLPSLGAQAMLWVNGHAVGPTVDTLNAGPAVRLNRAELVAGANHLQLIVTPVYENRNHVPETTRLGTVRMFQPAPPAGRSLFSGLAQVIVQSTDEAGTIRVRATADGLAPAEVTINAAH